MCHQRIHHLLWLRRSKRSQTQQVRQTKIVLVTDANSSPFFSFYPLYPPLSLSLSLSLLIKQPRKRQVIGPCSLRGRMEKNQSKPRNLGSHQSQKPPKQTILNQVLISFTSLSPLSPPFPSLLLSSPSPHFNNLLVPSTINTSNKKPSSKTAETSTSRKKEEGETSHSKLEASRGANNVSRDNGHQRIDADEDVMEREELRRGDDEQHDDSFHSSNPPDMYVSHLSLSPPSSFLRRLCSPAPVVLLIIILVHYPRTFRTRS